jgi:glucose/arabinose dehydrogenase
MRYRLYLALSAIAIWGLGAAVAEEAGPGSVLKGQGAFGDWTTDAPGVRRLITVNDLPPPGATRSVDRGPKLVARPAGAMPKVPPGFAVELVAEKLTNPRKIITAPNGDLFVAESEANRVKVFRFDAVGKASISVFASGLSQPFGIAFYPPGNQPTHVYVANTGSVVRFPYQAGQTQAQGAPEMIVNDIPSGGRLRGGGHWTRDIVFTPDGKHMLVSVGSHSNNDDDAREKNRADVLQYDPDGKNFRIFASGIRNAVGLAIEPRTGVVWASVNERDGLGDDLVPDYVTHLEPGGFYGWPWYYIGNHPDPKHAGKHPELAAKVIVPDVLIQSHSASLCMAFYTATRFPDAYRGDAFAAEHGSWNRAHRTGYKVIRIPMKDGKATGEYEDFMTGFVTEKGDVWGRPVGVAVAADGSLLVSDDGGNRLWRVRYVEK